MNLYNTKIVKDRKFADVSERTIQLTRQDGKQIMDVDDIRDLVDGLQRTAAQKGDTIRILVRAMAIDGMKTLKGYNTDLMVDDFEDYYRNSVHDPSKFSFFSHLQITIEKEI
jgi:hypothetical protein